MTNIDRSVLTRFQPGQSGNPGGKAAGARNRISGRFLNDLADDYEQHGAAVDVARRVFVQTPRQFRHDLAEAALIAHWALGSMNGPTMEPAETEECAFP